MNFWLCFIVAHTFGWTLFAIVKTIRVALNQSRDEDNGVPLFLVWTLAGLLWWLMILTYKRTLL